MIADLCYDRAVAPPEQTVVFVLSSSHSGSTLLALLLGSHSQAAYIGELNKLFNAEQPGRCSLCDDRRAPCPLFHDVAERTPRDIYHSLFERTGKNVLIDNSKRLKWMTQHLNDASFNRKYIHVVRDPRGVMLSRKTRGRTMKLSHWPKQNRRFYEALAEPGRDSRLVLYNDLATRQEQTVHELTQWLGLEYEADQLEYWRVDHHGPGRNGATAAFLQDPGSADPAFYQEKARARFHDLRWRDQLDREIKDAIGQSDAVQLLLADMGLQFTDTGLERVG